MLSFYMHYIVMYNKVYLYIYAEHVFIPCVLFKEKFRLFTFQEATTQVKEALIC